LTPIISSTVSRLPEIGILRPQIKVAAQNFACRRYGRRAKRGRSCMRACSLLIPRLRMLHQQRKEIAGRIEAVLGELSAEGESGEHRDVTLLLCLPGAGRVVAATMLAEASASCRPRLSCVTELFRSGADHTQKWQALCSRDAAELQ
jgi:transposase